MTNCLHVFLLHAHIFAICLQNLRCRDDLVKETVMWKGYREVMRKKGAYFKMVRENDSRSLSSRHVTSHYFVCGGQKYTMKQLRQVAHLFSNIKVFGLQSAAMSSINSDSLLPESASYTSAIHVYIHHPC